MGADGEVRWPVCWGAEVVGAWAGRHGPSASGDPRTGVQPRVGQRPKEWTTESPLAAESLGSSLFPALCRVCVCVCVNANVLQVQGELPVAISHLVLAGRQSGSASSSVHSVPLGSTSQSESPEPSSTCGRKPCPGSTRSLREAGWPSSRSPSLFPGRCQDAARKAAWRRRDGVLLGPVLPG